MFRNSFSLATLFLTSLLLFATGAFGASVWQQMQSGDLSRVRGQIKSMSIDDRGLQFEFTSKVNGRELTQQSRFCDDQANQETESYRSAQMIQRMEVLREALRGRSTVQLTYNGPWNPCVTSVSLIR